MTEVSKTLILPYNVQQMFALVNAIEDYPQFLPWCKRAEIHARTDQEIIATLVVAKGVASFKFTTANTIKIVDNNNNNNNSNISIDLKLVKGPFSKFAGGWSFIACANNTCSVTFQLVFTIANSLLAIALESTFHSLVDTLLASFAKRAEQLYGKPILSN